MGFFGINIDLNPFDDPGGPLEVDLVGTVEDVVGTVEHEIYHAEETLGDAVYKVQDTVEHETYYATRGIEHEVYYATRNYDTVDLNPFDANEALEIDLNATFDTISQAIQEDPIGTIGAVILAFTPGAQPWAYALVSGASAAARGKSPQQIVEAMALSYFGASAGDVVANQAEKYLTAAGIDQVISSSAEQVFGTSLSKTIGSSAGDFTRTLIHTQGDFEAAANSFLTGSFNQAMGQSLGIVDDLLPDGWNSLNEGVKQGIAAGINAGVKGEDVTEASLNGLLRGYTEAVIPLVQEYVDMDLMDGSKISEENITLITEALGNSFNAALQGASPEQRTDAFFAKFRENADEKFREYINSADGLNINKKLDDIFGNTADTTAALQAVKAKQLQMDDAKARFDALAKPGSDLYEAYMAAYNASVADNTSKAKYDAFEAAKAKLLRWQSVNEPKLDAIKAEYAQYKEEIVPLVDTYNTASQFMLSDLDEFQEEFTPVKDIADEIAATTLSPVPFDMDAYREQNGLGPDENVYQHYLNNKLQADTNAFMANMENFNSVLNDLSSDTLEGVTLSELTPVEYQNVIPKLATPEALDKPYTAVEQLAALDAIVTNSDKEEHKKLAQEWFPTTGNNLANAINSGLSAEESLALSNGELISGIENLANIEINANKSIGERFAEGLKTIFGDDTLFSNTALMVYSTALGEQASGIPQGLAEYADKVLDIFNPKNLAQDLDPANNRWLQGVAEKNGGSAEDYMAETLGSTLAEVLGIEDFEGAPPSMLFQDAVRPYVQFSQQMSEDIANSMGYTGKKALEGSQYTGDLVFKDIYGIPIPVDVENVSLGEDPSFYGYTLHASQGVVDLFSNVVLGGIFGKAGLALGGGLDSAEATGMAAIEIESAVYSALQNEDYLNGAEYQDFLAKANGDTALANALLMQEAKSLIFLNGIVDGVSETVLAGLVLKPVSKYGSDAIKSGVKEGTMLFSEAVAEGLDQGITNYALVGVDIPDVGVGDNVIAGMIGGPVEASPVAVLSGGVTGYQKLVEAIELGDFSGTSLAGPTMGLSMLVSSIASDMSAADFAENGGAAIIKNAIKQDLYVEAASFIDSYPNIFDTPPLSSDKTFMDINDPQGGGVFSEEDLEEAAGLAGNYVIFDDGILSTYTGDVKYIMDQNGLTAADIKMVGAEALKQIEADNPDLFAQLTPSQKVPMADRKKAEAIGNFLESEIGLDTKDSAGILNNIPEYSAVTITPGEITYEIGNIIPDGTASEELVQGAIDNLSGVKLDSDVATLVASYVDPYYLDTQEVINAAAAEGVTLTEEQAAQYVREVENDEDAAAEIAAEYDPQVTTYDEANQILLDLGYDVSTLNPYDTPPLQLGDILGSVSEILDSYRANAEWRKGVINSFTTGTEDEMRALAEGFVDPRQVTEDEARSAFEAAGFTPTDEEIAQFVGTGVNPAFTPDTMQNIAAYVDPRQTTEAEVRSAFEAAGFTPTDEQVAQFVGQLDQAAQETAIGQFVDPRQTTEAEVRSAFDALGFTPTDEQVAQFVGQLDQAAQETAVGQFVDPRQTTEDEVRAAFAALGFTPTDEQVAQFVGQLDQAAQETAIGQFVDPRQTTEAEVRSAFEAAGFSPTDEEVAQFVGQLDQAAQETKVGEYVDPRQTTEDEVRAAFEAAGFSPTDEEVATFVGQLNQAAQETAIGEYVDPRQTTEAEVRAAFDVLGFTPTDEEVGLFVGQLEQSAQETAIGEYVDPRQTTEDEVRAAFEALGFTPTDEQVTQFVGQYNQSVQETAVGEYVDPRQTTEAEVRAAFDALGFTPTDAEVTQFVGQLDQAAQETAVGQFVDPRQVTDEEARQFFADLGYTPTDEQVAEFVAQVSETEQAAAIASYVDPRQVTLAEVQAIAAEEGLTLTDALAATYVGQGVAANYQTEKLSAARAEYDPLATTLEEATEFFANTGYTATPEEIAQFVASKTEETQTSAIGAYVDPRQVTAVEAEEFLSAIGYQPSQSDIEQFTGQLNDENYQAAQKAAIDEYVDPRFFSAGEVRAAYEELGLVDVTQEDVDRFVGQFDPESEDYDPAGFEAFQRAKLESYLPTATYNLISKTIGSPSVADDPNTPEDESKEATGIYKAIEEGSAKDAALQEAIDALSTDLGLTETELLKQLGTTKTDLEKSIGDVETSLGEDISDLADVIGTPAVEDDPDTLDVDESQDPTGIFADIADLVASGSTRDEAIQTIADNLGTTKTDLETAIANIDVTEQITSVIGTELGTPATDDAEATGIFADIADLVASGSTRDEAIQTIADNLGTTKTDLEKAIGAVETSLGADISDLADVIGTPATDDTEATGIFADIADLVASGSTRDEAIQAVADNLGTTKTDLEKAIGAVETSLGEDISGLAGILGTPEVLDDPNTLDVDESQDPTGLFATIKQYENAGVERDEALDLAIGNVSTALGTTETNLLDIIGTTKDDLLAIIGGPATDDTAATGIFANIDQGLGELSTSIGADIDAIADIIGKPAREVTQVDVDFVIDLIAQENISQELVTQYDVTGDGIIDINDQTLLETALQGENVAFADTSIFGPATGLYGTTADIQQQLQSDINTQTDTITDLVMGLNTQLNTNINTQAQQQALRDLVSMEQAGLFKGAKATVSSADPMNIDYLYDFSSIFANPSQQGLFASPYSTTTRNKAANQPMGPMPTASGFAKGGQVEDENDMLLRILGDM